ncbi:hypothetical protein B9Z55_020179 [Caenorhabditis nigoni]|uniref:Uncharacterized protein n=1 Tax=Caenorhabditis nigoni TaxID=1611254 RepID=A0A2G5TLK2_9PELO|nr:hypothetical protein B9Z55_020179 [Caenorhabditis nigoni]
MTPTLPIQCPDVLSHPKAFDIQSQIPNIHVVAILLDLLATNQLMSDHHLLRCPNSSYPNPSSPHHLPSQSRESRLSPTFSSSMALHIAALFQSSVIDQIHLKSYLYSCSLHLTSNLPIWCSIAPFVSTAQSIRSPIIENQIRASLLSSSIS